MLNELEIEMVKELQNEIGLNEFGIDKLEMVHSVLDCDNTIEELHELAIADKWDNDLIQDIPTKQDIEWFEVVAYEIAIEEHFDSIAE